MLIAQETTGSEEFTEKSILLFMTFGKPGISLKINAINFILGYLTTVHKPDNKVVLVHVPEILDADRNRMYFYNYQISYIPRA